MKETTILADSAPLQAFYSHAIANAQTLEEISKRIDTGTIADEHVDMSAADTIPQAYALCQIIHHLYQKEEKDKLITYVKNELPLIRQLLYDALTRLEAIKITSKKENREAMVSNLAVIMRRISESYGTWVLFPGRDDVKAEVAEVSGKLKDYAREFEQYGFAHFHSIWIAVIFELLLLEYAKRPAKEIKGILENHLLFFLPLLRPELPGSVAHLLNKTAVQINEMAARFPATTYVNRYNRITTEGQRTCDTDWEQGLTITGDLFSGYDYLLKKPKILRQTCQNDSSRNDHGTGGGRGKSLATLKGTAINLNAIMNSYTNARESYLGQLLPVYKDLQSAFSCSTFCKEQLGILIARLA